MVGRGKGRVLVRGVVQQLTPKEAPEKQPRASLPEDVVPRGGIYAALRASPLVGVELGVARETGEWRSVRF